MKVLVTGCNGYIGSHVVKALKQAGHWVEGWDINFHGEHNDVSDYLNQFEKVDVTCPYAVHGTYDTVVHLAGRGSVPQSMIEPSEYYRVNTFGTDNMLKKVTADHFIFAGTSSSWAMASPYARSKVAAEDIIKEKSNGHTIFRFFNASGTDGVFRQLGPATHLIRVAAMVAAGKLPYITIHGVDYDTRDGTCIRDYIHVVDIANAIVNAVNNGPKNTPYECLGSKQGFTVREVLDTMQNTTGKLIHRILGPRREGDSVSNIVDELSDYCEITKTLQQMCLDQYNLEINNIR